MLENKILPVQSAILIKLLNAGGLRNANRLVLCLIPRKSNLRRSVYIARCFFCKCDLSWQSLAPAIGDNTSIGRFQ